MILMMMFVVEGRKGPIKLVFIMDFVNDSSMFCNQ